MKILKWFDRLTDISGVLFLCLAGSVFAGMLFFSLKVSAEEIQDDDYTSFDFEQDERLNSLELRLEELGYSVEDIKGALELMQADILEREETQLLLSEKLDLAVIALNDLINYDIELLQKLDAAGLEREEHWTDLSTSLSLLQQTAEQQAVHAMDGNSLASALNDTLKTNGENSEKSMEEQTVYMLLFLGIIGGLMAGNILSRFLKHD